MTTIAGGVDGGRVFIAADTQVVDDNYYAAYDAQKIVRKGDIIMGIAGDYRAAVTFEQAPTGKFKYNSEPGRYMALNFANNMHEFYDQHEIMLDGFEALVGTKGMLFYYKHDELHVSPAGLYCAVGTGGPFALGSLYQTGKNRGAPITTRLRAAIEAGIHFDTQSGGTTAVVSI